MAETSDAEREILDRAAMRDPLVRQANELADAIAHGHVHVGRRLAAHDGYEPHSHEVRADHFGVTRTIAPHDEGTSYCSSAPEHIHITPSPETRAAITAAAQSATGQPYLDDLADYPPTTFFADGTFAGLIADLVTEMRRQDAKHGRFTGTDLGRARLAIACLEDETREARDAWRAERTAGHWHETTTELLQAAALALRGIRDMRETRP